MSNSEPVSSLKGIGEKTGKLFEKLGVITIDDLLSYYPRAYDTYEPPGGRASLEPSILAVAFAIFMRSAFIGFPPVDVLERWPSHKDHRFGAKVK